MKGKDLFEIKNWKKYRSSKIYSGFLLPVRNISPSHPSFWNETKSFLTRKDSFSLHAIICLNTCSKSHCLFAVLSFCLYTGIVSFNINYFTRKTSCSSHVFSARLIFFSPLQLLLTENKHGANFTWDIQFQGKSKPSGMDVRGFLTLSFIRLPTWSWIILLFL